MTKLIDFVRVFLKKIKINYQQIFKRRESFVPLNVHPRGINFTFSIVLFNQPRGVS